MRSIGLMVLVPMMALAAGKKPAVVVDGPAAMVKVVSVALAAKYSPLASKRSLGTSPTTKEVRDVTAPANAIAVVLVEPTVGFLSIVVLNGADGTPIDRVNVRTSKQPLKALPRASQTALFEAVAQGVAPSAKKAKPVIEEAPAPAVASTSEPIDPTDEAESASSGNTSVRTRIDQPSRTSSITPALRAAVGPRGFSRAFAWGTGASPALAGYSLGFGPALGVDAQWFPGAHFTDGVLSNLGVAFTGDFSLGVVSRVDTSRFGTQATRIRASAVYRQALLDSRAEVDAQLGVATQSFTISQVAMNDGSARPNIPSVAFVGPRLAAGGRMRVYGSIDADATLGFQVVVGKGELASAAYFPNSTAVALDAGLGASIKLMPNISARLGVDVSRYFITLHAANSALAGTTASDTSFGASLSVAWVM